MPTITAAQVLVWRLARQGLVPVACWVWLRLPIGSSRPAAGRMPSLKRCFMRGSADRWTGVCPRAPRRRHADS